MNVTETNASKREVNGVADEGPPFVERPDVAELRQAAQERLEAARSWIRDNPLPALGIALTAGFVAGRIFRR